MCSASFGMEQKADIQDDHGSGSEDQQPYDQSLFEVFLKSSEKCFRCAVVIPFYGTHHAVIEGSQWRPDGDHGDAAENKKKIGDHDVAQFVEEYMNDIIFI